MKQIPLLLLGLMASFVLHSQCYAVAQTTYVPDTTTYTSQTIATVADDQWSQVIPIGFTFCYYGAQFDSLLVGTNAAITFNTSQTGGFCPWPIPASNAPSGTFGWSGIMGPWHDLQMYQQPASKIFCWTSGVAPNRTFTLKYDSIPMYSCTSLVYSGRILLHETSNNIEVQIDVKNSCSWNASRAILGIQSPNSLQATVVPGRNATNAGWSASQEGWLFTPICNVCSGIGIAESETKNLFDVYPNPSKGDFTLQIQNSTIASYDVIDISGRIVRSSQVNTQQQVQFTLENSGMYFIRVFDDSNTMLKTEKLVVE